MDDVGGWLKTQVRRLLDGLRDGEEVLNEKIQEWIDSSRMRLQTVARA